jgi:hypothetical protein
MCCREAVDADSPWNQALKAHLPDLFVSSLQHFLALEAPEGAWRHHWLDWWLKAVPLQGEAQVGGCAADVLRQPDSVHCAVRL